MTPVSGALPLHGARGLDAETLGDRFREVRAATLALAKGLSPEDLVAQSMPDASPGKWHLAHTTWFFEVMLLEPHAGVAPLRPDWLYLFNSYYEALGERHPRPQRGLLTRPSLDEVLAYRQQVEARVLDWLAGTPSPEGLATLELGLNHEQQHQELFVTDFKHLLAQNPMALAWRPGAIAAPGTPAPMQWIERREGGTTEIGAEGDGFAFDNERPRHRVWLEPFALASRPLCIAEVLEFIAADGYRDPQWWLSDGWAVVQDQGWEAPLYWSRGEDGEWTRYSVQGQRPLDPAEPAAHLSYYEADALARFLGARLPTEAEWETVAREQACAGGFTDSDRLEPAPCGETCFGGEVWEWTASAYAPYPGFRPLPGAAGEYNGKFMSGQMVLRGGSCATPRSHWRPSYRNFFPPSARWQFSGLRLARDLA